MSNSNNTSGQAIIVTASRELWPVTMTPPEEYGNRRTWTGLEWECDKWVAQILSQYLPISRLRHGSCRGGDTLAHMWFASLGREADQHPANWKLFGKAAGMIRNIAMLELDPTARVVGFPGPDSVGTWGCMKEAVKRGMVVDCYEFTRDGPKPSVKSWKP